METANFVDWIKNVFIPHCSKISGPKLLTMDGHKSHISLEVAKLARENSIHLLCLPSHSSHLLQPLDVGVFSAVKAQWKKIVDEYFRRNTSGIQTSGYKNIEKTVFAELFSKLKNSNKAFQRRHIVAGFEATGKLIGSYFICFNPKSLEY